MPGMEQSHAEFLLGANGEVGEANVPSPLPSSVSWAANAEFGKHCNIQFASLDIKNTQYFNC